MGSEMLMPQRPTISRSRPTTGTGERFQRELLDALPAEVAVIDALRSLRKLAVVPGRGKNISSLGDFE